MPGSNGVTLTDVLATLTEINESEHDPSDEELVIITDWQVKSEGRLTIPSGKREKYDIEEGDDLDAILMVKSD